MMELMQTDLPEPVLPAMRQCRHFRKVGDNRMAIDVLAERDGDARLGVAPFVRLEQNPA